MKSIRDMDISARAKSCLMSAGYKYVYEIANLSSDELRCIRNLNEKCVEEILDDLLDYSGDEDLDNNISSDDGTIESDDYESETESEDSEYVTDPPIIKLAKRIFSSFNDLSIDALDAHWTSDDINGLIYYDVFHVSSVLFLMSDEDERNEIIHNLENLFGFEHTQQIIVDILDEYDPKKFITELFRRIPLTIGLLFEYDQENCSNLSYSYYEVIELLTYSVLSPYEQLQVDSRAFFLIGLMEIIKNRLLCSGIENNNEIVKGVPKFETVLESFDYSIDGYIAIEEVDEGAELYKIITEYLKKIPQSVEHSKKFRIDTTCSRKKYQDASESMLNADYNIELSRAIIASIRIETSVGDDSEEDYDDEFEDDEDDFEEEDDDDESKEDYSSIYEERVDVNELLQKLEDSEKRALDLFGHDCKLILRNTVDHVDKVVAIGTVRDCVYQAKDNIKRLGNYDWFLIRYGEGELDTTYTFRHIADGIISILEVIDNTSIPFDACVLPISYKAFSKVEIDDNDFKKLWDDLKVIEKKYSRGINYNNRIDITDWESELFYEQGKYLENIKWKGSKIAPPKIDIPYCTYGKMNFNQLKYYLYWRTCFRNGENIITGFSDYYYLCVYELLAELGPYTPEERLKQLERLYSKYKDEDLGNSKWVEEYANYHNLKIQDDIVIDHEPHVSWWDDQESFQDIAKVINGEYKYAFGLMCKKSAWKFKNSSFIQKSNCLDDIRIVVENILPKLDDLFSKSGISFSDFLVGRVKTMEGWYILPYGGEILCKSVIERIGLGTYISNDYMLDDPECKVYFVDDEGNILQKTNIMMHYYDAYLSEYILKYTEMLFRQHLGYKPIAFPNKLVGSLKVKLADGKHNVLAADSKLKKHELIYISLYDSIEQIIIKTTNEYFEEQNDRVDELDKNFAQNYQPPIRVASEKTIPIDERMIACICKDYVYDGQFEELLDIYDEATNSFKNTKAKKLSNMIWDFWILRDNHISYSELSEKVVKNKWYITEKKSIEDRNYEAALPYLCTFYDVFYGVVGKKIESNIIKDCIIITFSILNDLFNSYGIDFSELILGEWETIPWVPFSEIDDISKVITTDINKNVGGIEYYSIKNGFAEGCVSRHSYSKQADEFATYILKSIDNKLRVIIGYKSFLSNDIDIAELFDMPGYKMACEHVDRVITAVVNHTYSNSAPANKTTYDAPLIEVSSKMDREYVFAGELCEIKCIDDFIDEELANVYGKEYQKMDTTSLFGILTVDFDEFDLTYYCNKYPKEERYIQTSLKINLYRFRDAFDDLVDSFIELADNYPIDYNPKYDFTTTPLMKDINGLQGRDLTVLKKTISDNESFLQWLVWLENGRIVLPKNIPYIQLMYYFSINRIIFEDTPQKCLVVMCEIWNCIYDSVKKIDDAANLMLEWIKDYWIVYCADVSYEDFKNLFRYDIVFENENCAIYAKEHYLVDITTMKNDNLLDFYNSNCDYHVLDGALVKKGHRDILERAIEKVHEELEKLWKHYDLNFEKYLHYEDKIAHRKDRQLFRRTILTGKTKRFLRENFDGRDVSEYEVYQFGYYHGIDWPGLIFEQYEISNNSSRILLDYIIKHTEKVLRIYYGLNFNFKFDDYRLYDLFSDQLFEDNLDNQIIVKTIEKAAKSVLKEIDSSYISSEDEPCLEYDKWNDTSNKKNYLSLGNDEDDYEKDDKNGAEDFIDDFDDEDSDEIGNDKSDSTDKLKDSTTIFNYENTLIPKSIHVKSFLEDKGYSINDIESIRHDILSSAVKTRGKTYVIDCLNYLVNKFISRQGGTHIYSNEINNLCDDLAFVAGIIEQNL